MLALEGAGYEIDAIERLCDGARFAPEPLTPAWSGTHSLMPIPAKAPPYIAGDYP